MVKFGRNYLLKVQKTDDAQDSIKIEPPFTIEFEIQRNNYSTGCNSSFRIYNLAEETRSQIRKDQREGNLHKSVLFSAGYGDDIAVLLTAEVSRAWSVREGNNFITQIECFDQGLVLTDLGQVSVEYPGGMDYRAIVIDLVKKLKPLGIDIGGIGNVSGKTVRAKSYSGDIVTILKEITGGAFFIDNGRAYVLNDDEYMVTGGSIVIDASTGLLGTPTLNMDFLSFDILFDPKITIGSKISLRSATNKTYNKDYIVLGLTHKGIISPVNCGIATTTIKCITFSDNARAVSAEVIGL